MKRKLLIVAAVLVAAFGTLSWLDRPLDSERIAAGEPPMPTAVPPAHPPAGLAFSVIETSHSAGTLEALIVGGGSWTTIRRPVHMAVLVRHPQASFLFDLGLGRQVDAQVAVNSAFHKQLFGYAKVDPAVDQLTRAGLDPASLAFAVPSHMHWDHVSALPDFPALPVLAGAAERAGAAAGQAPYFLASQFAAHPHWRELRFDGPPYLGFRASRDLFGDGSAVLVPLTGHTAGQVGLALTLPSGKRYLFTGDVTWTARGIATPADRGWIARRIMHLDHDEAANQAAIVRLHRLQRAQPALTIVPAHDETLLPALPRFPRFES